MGQLVQLLGEGSYGSVHRTDTNQAVKIVLSDKVLTPCLVEPFLMNSLKHPYLMTSKKSFYNEDESIYVYQELATCNLGEYLERQECSVENIQKWAFQMLSALNYMHKREFIHGDIKSHNILIMPDDNIKVADFSLSCKFRWRKRYNVCTYTHRPPEAWRGNDWNEKADIWAFGCTLYEMIYRSTLMPIEPDVEKRKILYLEIFDDWPSWLPNVQPIIRRILNPDPDLRPNCLELLADPFFSNLTPIFACPQIGVKYQYEHVVKSIVDRCVDSEYSGYKQDILDLASKFYTRTISNIGKERKKYSDSFLALGCCASAYQLVLRIKELPNKINLDSARKSQAIVLNVTKFRIPNL